MLVTVEEARTLCYQKLTGNGLEPHEARIVTDVLVEAELRGRKTHGLMRVPLVIRRRARKQPRPVKVIRENEAFALLDGGDNLGYVVAHRCAQTALAKAEAHGVATVGANNLGHTGMMGYYVSLMAEAGVVGLGVCDCVPCVAPWGGTQPVFGTNPIAIGIPTGGACPILIDLATSALTMGDVALAEKRGERIQRDCAVDEAGRPTDDPAEARKGALLPFGEHKGYALGLAVQIFCSALVGAAVMPEPGRNYGVFFMAIDPGAFVGIEDFHRDVSRLTQAAKSTNKMAGVEEIMIPGERAYRQRSRRLAEGIEIDEALYTSLRETQTAARPSSEA